MNDPTCSRFPTPMPGEGRAAPEECSICRREYDSVAEPEVTYYGSPVCARCADDSANRCGTCDALLADDDERENHGWDAHGICPACGTEKSCRQCREDFGDAD